MELFTLSTHFRDCVHLQPRKNTKYYSSFVMATFNRTKLEVIASAVRLSIGFCLAHYWLTPFPSTLTLTRFNYLSYLFSFTAGSRRHFDRRRWGKFLFIYLLIISLPRTHWDISQVHGVQKSKNMSAVETRQNVTELARHVKANADEQVNIIFFVLLEHSITVQGKNNTWTNSGETSFLEIISLEDIQIISKPIWLLMISSVRVSS